MPIRWWRPQFFKRFVAQNTERRMRRVVNFLANEVRVSISRPNPSGKEPSLPGEPPKTTSGRLLQSTFATVTNEGNQVRGSYGTKTPYSRELELGTSKMAARPHVRPALQNNRNKVARMFGRSRAGGHQTGSRVGFRLR